MANFHDRWKLEFTEDDLSVANADATWVDVTGDVRDGSMRWSSGIERLGDEPRPGEMSFTMKGRDFEPLNAGELVNLIENPSFENSIATVVAGGGTTVGQILGDGSVGANCLEVTATGAGAGNVYNRKNDGSRYPAAAGEVWTVSADARYVVGAGRQLRLGVEQYDGGGALLGSQLVSIALTSSFDRYEATFTLALGTAEVRVITGLGGSGAAGDKIRIDGVQFEQAAAATEYVDGDQPHDRWAGSAHASASYRGGPYYPNVKRWARFLLSLDRGAGFEPEFLGYARTFQPQWPGGTSYQEVDIVCGDGFDVLAKNPLPALDPPDAESYGDVVDFDGPSFAYTLGDQAGVKTVAKLRSARWLRRHPHATRRQKHYRTRETRVPLAGVSGASGTYKNTPTLGEPGAILGDADTCVRFRNAQTEYARVPLDASETIDGNQLTVEVWAKLASDIGMRIVDGPSLGPADGRNTWRLERTAGSPFRFAIADSGSSGFIIATGTTVPATDTWYHLVGTWDGNQLLLYVDAVLEATADGLGRTLLVPPADYIYIGGHPLAQTFDGWLDEVAIYEKVLSQARIAAHHTAGTARGYAEQSVQDRITALALTDAAAPWDSITIAGGDTFDVVPIMQHGQSRLAEIVHAMVAEGVRSHFYFGRDGNPVYLGWEWQATGTYSAPQAAFGAPAAGGEIEFTDLALSYDDEIYNVLPLSREDGGAVTVENADSIAANGESEAEPITGLLNTDDADVELLGQELLTLYANPTWTLSTLDTIGSDLNEDALAQLCDRDIGDQVRFTRRGDTGPDIEVLTWILGYEKRIESGDVLTGTWNLARGWNVGEDAWLLGIDGFSELDDTTTLG